MSAPTPQNRRRGPSVSSLALAALVAAALLGLLSAVLVTGGPRGATPVLKGQLGTRLTINAPIESRAGQIVTLQIAGAPIASDQVQLVQFGSLSTTTSVHKLDAGSASITIDASHTTHAGLIHWVAVAGSASGNASTMITPGNAVDPVTPLVGPRTVIADGDDFTMVVASPTDEFGNPVADDTRLMTTVERPDGTRTRDDISVNAGIAAQVIASQTRAGRVTVSVTAGDAIGPTTSFDQVAGVPAAFRLSADDTPKTADGFTLHTLETGTLLDQYDNLLPDGINVVFGIEGPQGRTQIDSTVQSGTARANFEAPGLPGVVEITARVSGRTGEPLRIDFDPAVSEVSAAAIVDGSDVKLSIGPVRLIAGGYVPDGTDAIVVDADGAVVAKTGLFRGESTMTVPGEVGDSFEIYVLGKLVRVVVAAGDS